jgi:RNA polymerase sigma factor (sigma-70 family)
MAEAYEIWVQIAQAAEVGAQARREAFDALIKCFERMTFRWAYEVLEDTALAEDAAQEAFLTAYEHLDQLKEPGAFPGWLKSIVRSSCYRLTRRKRLPSQQLGDSTRADLSHPDPSQEYEVHEQNEMVERAVNDLPRHERVVVEMFYLSDYSQQEIADRLALPLTTVKKRLQYARDHLREKLFPVAGLVPHFDSEAEMIRWYDADNADQGLPQNFVPRAMFGFIRPVETVEPVEPVETIGIVPPVQRVLVVQGVVLDWQPSQMGQLVRVAAFYGG